MPLFFSFYILVIALFFIFYGLQCLYSPFMRKEFERYGLPQIQRVLTGILQLLGALGLIMGFYMPWMGMMAAAGLTVMMAVAFGVRIKIKDGFKETAPSFIFMLMNAYLVWQFYLYV